MQGPPKYVVITPVRDEAPYIERTISSLIGQTVPAQQWIVVDDGSTDGTDRKSTRLNSSHIQKSRMPSSA